MASWINKDLFPFESKFVEIDGHRMHYIDEGSGPVILFSHGTPEWSFGWRDLVRLLRDGYRCIAPDLLGFGLSDKPLDADYSVKAHSERLEKFIDKLHLKQVNLVANDFGLGIALAWAIRHPDRVDRISIFNGWMWPVDNDPHYSKPAKVLRSRFGKAMYLWFNAPVNMVMPAAYGDKKMLTREVHRHYKQALPNAKSRKAAYTFALQLLDAGPFWADAWQNLHRISEKQFLIFWGLKDSFVPPYELEKWEKALPHAHVIRFETAGHFCQEEKPEAMADSLRVFFR